jgi:hypothetical protein
MSEIDRPRPEPPARRDRGGGAARRDAESFVPIYQALYEESKRSLDDQQDELNRIRDRAVQFIIFVGAAAAFLVGTGLTAVHNRDWVFYLIASVASLTSAVSVGLLIALLKPRKGHKWNFRISSESVIEDIESRDVPVPTESQFMRYLVKLNDEMQVENEKLIEPLRNIYQWLMAVGVLQLVFWAALVWIRT